MLSMKNVNRRLIDRLAIALPALAWAGTVAVGGVEIGHETQPVQIVEDRGLVPGSTSFQIVILDAQQHAAAKLAGRVPDVACVQHVTQMQPAGRRRRETRE